MTLTIAPLGIDSFGRRPISPQKTQAPPAEFSVECHGNERVACEHHDEGDTAYNPEADQPAAPGSNSSSFRNHSLKSLTQVHSHLVIRRDGRKWRSEMSESPPVEPVATTSLNLSPRKELARTAHRLLRDPLEG